MLCLVLAMSGTSALLGWIDRQSRLSNPFPTSNSQALSQRQIDRLVQSVVAEASDIRPTRWESISIVSGPTGDGREVSAYTNRQTSPAASMFLTAETTGLHPRYETEGSSADKAAWQGEYHFRIDPNGCPFASDAWVRQAGVTQDPTAIVIQVTPLGEDRSMTPTQSRCVRTLVEALSAPQRSRLAYQLTVHRRDRS